MSWCSDDQPKGGKKESKLVDSFQLVNVCIISAAEHPISAVLRLYFSCNSSEAQASL